MTIADLKASINLAEVIGHYIDVRRAGASYRAYCPFHSEKTPSFQISNTKQMWHCFGCDEGGDVFSFVQKYHKVNFGEALREVCGIVNIPYESITDSFRGSNERSLYFGAMLRANESFKRELFKDNQQYSKIRSYLYERGLTDGDFDKFDIGLCPPLENLGLTEADLALLSKLGVISNGRLLFSNRIMFAIKDVNGNVIGFAGREHPYGNFGGGKYINTPSSPIYQKSSVLYLAHLAKPAIRKGKVLVVEGYMDAIAAYKLGRDDVVATCGTALCREHLAKIGAINQDAKICFCFDNDEAGDKANIRALETSIQCGYFNLYTTKVKGDKDIGDLLQKGEKLELYAQKGFGYYVKYLVDNAPNKDRALDGIRRLIAKQGIYTQRELIKQTSQWLKLTEEEIGVDKVKDEIQAKSVPQNVVDILKALEKYPNFIDVAVDLVAREDFGEYGEIFGNLINGGELDKDFSAIVDTNSINSVESFKESLKCLKITRLKQDLAKAKANKDIASIIHLQDALIGVSQW